MFRPVTLTLLGDPESFSVSGQHLVHDSSELVEQLQALLFSHARVVEAGQPCLREREREREMQCNVS